LTLEHSLRVANERNRVLSITDDLTGAYNRRYLMEQLPRELERCRRYGYPLTVIMCDIDHFKRINDEKGHSVGDDVLQQFMCRMQTSIRRTSDWIARYGGEEFLLVLPEADFKAGMMVAEKVRAIISSLPFMTRGGDASVTASFGVASTGPTGPDLLLKVDGLIRAADQCLYCSKQEGRNRTTSVQIPNSVALVGNA
jgi:two-component system cell cycle response regulator